MADSKVKDLTAKNTLSDSDQFYLNDVENANVDKRIAASVIKTYTNNGIASDTMTLTNKTFNANGAGNSITNIETADIAAGSKSGLDSDLVTGTAGTSGNILVWNADGDAVDGGKVGSQLLLSNTSGVTGADAVTNIMSLTQSEYNAIGSPNASTFYIITDA